MNYLILCFSLYSILSSCKYKYDLAMFTMFRNEARFLREFIEFHKLVGFQHFYLYNDGSTDNYQDVLRPYIKSGQVEVIEWENKSPVSFCALCDLDFPIDLEEIITRDTTQRALRAYNDCIARTRGRVKWLALLDADEYLFPVAFDNLLDFLRGYEEYGGVCANWVMFGTSGVKSIPDGDLLIRHLIKCQQEPSNQHVKSIVRPERVESIPNQHYADYKPGFFAVNADKIRSSGMYFLNGPVDKLRINHYWTGDEERFFNVKIPNRISFYGEKERAFCLEHAKPLNARADFTIHKYLARLQRNMQLLAGN